MANAVMNTFPFCVHTFGLGDLQYLSLYLSSLSVVLSIFVILSFHCSIVVSFYFIKLKGF